MSNLNKIFGDWDTPPETGDFDPVAQSWHWLAAQHVGTPEQKNNFGLSQRRGEWTMLIDLYLRAKPKIVVEIGVAQSGTAAGWCIHGQPHALLIFIDRCLNDSRPRPGDPGNENVYSGPLSMYSNGGGVHHLGRKGQIIRGINGWSYDNHVFSQLKTLLNGHKIDWLWTDSSHEASMFDKEFEMYWPLVAEGGVFCTHDIQLSAHPEVTKWKSWERIKQEETYSMMMEFKGSRNDDSYGVGILIK